MRTAAASAAVAALVVLAACTAPPVDGGADTTTNSTTSTTSTTTGDEPTSSTERTESTDDTGSTDDTAAVATLTVAAEGFDADYDRDLFGDWITQPDGCSTRERVLLDEAIEDPDVGASCTVGPGEWQSVYDGVTVADPGDLDIDHLVPLAEAWASGASEWSDQRREEFANNLADPHALIAVTAGSNRSKGDRDPAEWQPPQRSVWCDYATAWIDVKVEWGLTADPAEVAELATMLETCPV